MQLPDRVKQIVRLLHAAHTDLANGSDDQRRQLTKMIAEQVCFELGPMWGTKRADSSRPPSKDAIAQQQSDGKLFSWDWQNGATRAPIESPESEDISGQVFIPVERVKHLPLPGPGPVKPDPSLAPELAAFIADVRASLGRIETVLKTSR